MRRSAWWTALWLAAKDDLKAAGGWKEIWDNSAKAHFLYNSSLGQLYTYDSVQSVEEKTNYCISKSCGARALYPSRVVHSGNWRML